MYSWSWLPELGLKSRVATLDDGIGGLGERDAGVLVLGDADRERGVGDAMLDIEVGTGACSTNRLIISFTPWSNPMPGSKLHWPPLAGQPHLARSRLASSRISSCSSRMCFSMGRSSGEVPGGCT